MKSFILTVKNILWLYKPYLKYGKLFVFLSFLFWVIIIPIAQVVSVYLPSTIVNMLQENRPFADIVIVVILLQMILMFQPIFENIFNMFCKNKVLPYIDARLKYDVYEKAIQTDYKYIDDPEYYDNYSWAVGKYAGKAKDAQDMVNRIVSSVITIVSMLAVIAALRPLAVIVTILGTILENAMYIVTNYYDVKKDEEIVPYDRKLEYYHKIFYSNVNAADLKSTNLKKMLFDGYDVALNNKLQVIKKYGFKMIPWALSGVFTFYIARTFVILNIAYGIYTGNISSVATYIAMMAAVETLKSSMNEMFYYIKDANQLGLYAKRIRAFFDIKSEIETDLENKEAMPAAPFTIDFKHVFFQYENSNFHISDLNLKINSGEKIAIVGENGVGKSTLVKLLMRFYDVNSGEILINNSNIQNYNVMELRKRIGVAFQNSNIYAMSFAENLTLYQKADSETLQQMIKKTGLEKVLEKNNAKMTTELTKEFDKNGIMLSGGEIQKIAIARLLNGEFGLLLFDEPSSALDPIAEYEMTKLILDSGNRSTTIIVAHRLSTIRNADRIILIDHGKAAEVGTHEELMELHGKYYEMFTKQAENYIQ